MYNQIFFTNVLRLLDEQHMTKSELADQAGIPVLEGSTAQELEAGTKGSKWFYRMTETSTP